MILSILEMLTLVIYSMIIFCHNLLTIHYCYNSSKKKICYEAM